MAEAVNLQPNPQEADQSCPEQFSYTERYEYLPGARQHTQLRSYKSEKATNSPLVMDARKFITGLGERRACGG
ncbi:hypothetical protein PAAG_04543 [Paracoccidioides lutzii Pb01]|uniref:Uncharacterized protein n=1 Tax=Paracoccidioides lutzii (strain ATCC MYA-826 / Pb01) TaxID=502779 RepID=C1H199_PARBA|nr:hypothetical protein PAAG_04543 [Paracoccidioides lutzii Pb01]EEH33493.2 hypothetical protein PAAG_04543 [Paracoccidioides lutzii Pb01]